MGGGDAKKRLKEANAELARLAFEVDDWDQAIAQAEAAKGQAEEGEANEAERLRQERLRALADTAMGRASAFTDGLRQAVKAGAALRMVIQNMVAQCSPDEQRAVAILLRSECYQRAAEHAGLKGFIEFPGYRGPRDHVVALEDEVAVHLSHWLPQPDLDPPEGSGN